MALDIWVGDWNEKGSKLVASFDPEAYYCFLSPVFEDFEKEKGIMIDPYEGAYFDSKELDQVEQLVTKARTMVLSQPEQFDVHIGTKLGSYIDPKKEEIYSSVRRNDFLNFIENWKSAIDLARETNKPLIFYGD